MIKRRTINEDVGGEDLTRGVTNSDTTNGDSMLFQKIASLTAGAVTEIGEELVKAAHNKTQIGCGVFCEPVSAGIVRLYVGTKKPRVMNSRP